MSSKDLKSTREINLAFAQITEVLMDFDGTIYHRRDAGYRMECAKRVVQASFRSPYFSGIFNPLNYLVALIAAFRGLHTDRDFPANAQMIVHQARESLTYHSTKIDSGLKRAISAFRRDFPQVGVRLFTDGCCDKAASLLETAGIVEYFNHKGGLDRRHRDLNQLRSFKTDEMVFQRLVKERILPEDLSGVCVIDNDLSVIDLAARSGLMTIWVNSMGEQLDLTLKQPDMIVYSPSEALNFLYDRKKFEY